MSAFPQAQAGRAHRWLTGDAVPWLVLGAIALLPMLAMPLATWVNLTAAGLAMGVMVFTMAVGLTLVFGLMDVMNFAHGAFITVGAYAATSVMARLPGWSDPGSAARNLGAVGITLVVASAATGLFGYLFERVLIRPVYSAHMKQILITMGGLIVAEQLVTVIWGIDAIPLAKPAVLEGSFAFGDVIVVKFRVFAAVLGLLLFLGIHFGLNRTRLGLLVRAGVENREMVEALGYRIRALFVLVFVSGAALAGIGGVLWGMNEGIVSSRLGSEMMLLTFIVIIIGGLGSVGGCLFGAILVGLTYNYVAFLAPVLQLGSNIALMVLVLLWRPRGLFPLAKT
jgi:branched-chain amino acid transport system permease protein